MEDLYGDPAAIWDGWCEHPVARAVIDFGHHMAEESPGQLADTLDRFLNAGLHAAGPHEHRCPPR